MIAVVDKQKDALQQTSTTIESIKSTTLTTPRIIGKHIDQLNTKIKLFESEE